MMNKIFTFMILCGILFGALSGRMEQVSLALLEQGGRAVTLALSLMGSFCMWGGLMRVAEAAGLTELLAKAFAPLLGRVFSGLDRGGQAMRAVSMNVAANLLGLGNAATPLGIAAMKELQKCRRAGDCATDDMVLFVVMNTASMQLIPTTTAALRAAAGAPSPLDILPAVWIASAASLLVGITAAKLLSGRKDR